MTAIKTIIIFVGLPFLIIGFVFGIVFTISTNLSRPINYNVTEYCVGEDCYRLINVINELKEERNNLFSEKSATDSNYQTCTSELIKCQSENNMNNLMGLLFINTSGEIIFGNATRIIITENITSANFTGLNMTIGNITLNNTLMV